MPTLASPAPMVSNLFETGATHVYSRAIMSPTLLSIRDQASSAVIYFSGHVHLLITVAVLRSASYRQESSGDFELLRIRRHTLFSFQVAK